MKPCNTLILAAIIFTTMSCNKPVVESDVQSLDNYTAADGAKLTINTCHGPYENREYADLEEIEAPANLTSIVKKTLSSVPLSLREIFSTQLLGKIKISTDIKTDCKKNKKNLSESRLNTGDLDTASCLVVEEGVPGVTLVLNANEASIKHGLVRAFFAVVFTTMSESEFDEELKLLVPAAKNIDLIKLEKSVHSALKQDLAGKSEVNANIFAEPVDAVIEAADQYYCSPTTRESLRKNFEATYLAFKNGYVNIIHETGEKNPEEIYNEILKSDSQVSGPSLQLWGRWGVGNGPLRAWGRSRISARQHGGRGLFPNWNNARRQGYASGGRGLFPNWNNARRQGYAAGRRGVFPNARWNR